MPANRQFLKQARKKYLLTKIFVSLFPYYLSQCCVTKLYHSYIYGGQIE